MAGFRMRDLCPTCRKKVQALTRKYTREYYRKNREKCLARVRAWVARNPDYHRTYLWRKGKKWQRERDAAYREKNREKLRTYNRLYGRKRRARLRRAG